MNQDRYGTPYAANHRPPMAYYGGKTQLASRIAAALPPHAHYVEPFAGSLAVLLAKRPSPMETVNDIDGDLMNFWRVLRDRPLDLQRVCALTPHSRAEHQSAYGEFPADDLERARLTWVRISQGRSGTLRKTGWRYYVNPSRENGSPLPTYLNGYVDRMAAAAERLHHVSLECRPAIELITLYGEFPTVCLYLDPPYLGTVRNGRNYRNEMAGAADHVQMLETVLHVNASVVISGYASDLYDTALADWLRLEINTHTGQSIDYAPRTEVLWINRPASELTLFDAG